MKAESAKLSYFDDIDARVRSLNLVRGAYICIQSVPFYKLHYDHSRACVISFWWVASLDNDLWYSHIIFPHVIVKVGIAIMSNEYRKQVYTRHFTLKLARVFEVGNIGYSDAGLRCRELYNTRAVSDVTGYTRRQSNWNKMKTT